MSRITRRTGILRVVGCTHLRHGVVSASYKAFYLCWFTVLGNAYGALTTSFWSTIIGHPGHQEPRARGVLATPGRARAVPRRRARLRAGAREGRSFFAWEGEPRAPYDPPVGAPLAVFSLSTCNHVCGRSYDSHRLPREEEGARPSARQCCAVGRRAHLYGHHVSEGGMRERSCTLCGVALSIRTMMLHRGKKDDHEHT